MQRAKLPEATHHESVATLPPGPAIFLANEFLDALPIRQFLFRAGRWAERWVEAGRLVERPGHLPCLPDQAPDGAVMEVCEPARALAGHLAQRFAASPGLALFLDYGPEASGFGDSLQALRDARPADPLAEPGSADLTAHVDFAAFARAARAGGAAAHGPVPQGLFLQRLGLHRRAAALASRHPGSAAAILAAAHRLTAPEAMGQLFKALCLCHVDLPPPAGFEAP
jgi:SAM-dependent MidA family methyltransferase